jgi:hypothetical protein
MKRRPDKAYVKTCPGIKNPFLTQVLLLTADFRITLIIFEKN